MLRVWRRPSEAVKVDWSQDGAWDARVGVWVVIGIVACVLYAPSPKLTKKDRNDLNLFIFKVILGWFLDEIKARFVGWEGLKLKVAG